MLVLLVAVAALLAAGCGGDDEDDGSGAGADPAATTVETQGDGGETAAREPVELTVAIPFPSAIAFYPLYVAQERGYLEEEGITLRIEPVDGSGATLQLLQAGQADVALPSPGPFLQAGQRGAELVSVYTLYQSNVFSVQTLDDSEIDSLDDLRGETVGVGSLDGGETPFVRAALADAGLEEGDYELLAVGDGGTAALALRGGDVAAYSAAFPDVAIMRLRGLELRDILSEEFRNFFDSLVVVDRTMVEEQPEVVEGLGRALAKATVWGMENQEETVEIAGEAFPEEIEDGDFALALLRETQSLFELPDEADDRWGYATPEAVDRYTTFLVEQGELEEEPPDDVFVNDFVDAYNDFTEDDL